jgi:DNA-binding Lrp family transcriptional regulator
MIDEKRSILINELRKDSRKKLSRIAKEKGYPTSTLFDILKNLELKDILSHKTLINFEKIGYLTRIFVAVRTEYHNRAKLKEYLNELNNVNNLYIVDNDFDFIFEAVFKNQKEAYDFLDNFENSELVTEKRVFHIVQDVNREKFMI